MNGILEGRRDAGPSAHAAGMRCSAGTERSGYPRRMRADLLRRAGQAITALSAVVIAYATLRPNVSTTFADDTVLHFLLFMPLGAGGALWMAQLEPGLQKRAGIAIFGLILFFAAATELAQSLVDGRTASLTDFFADAAGGIFGLLIGGLMASRARRSAN